MAVVEVKKLPERKIKASELLTKLCFYYPQYSLSEARKLPYKHVLMLLNEAERQKAMHYYNLVQIVAAPQTNKGKGVKVLTEHFKGIANG